MSDRLHSGSSEYQDTSKLAILAELSSEYDVVATRLVPDETVDIQNIVTKYTDEDRVDLVLTCGGTGFAARDVTPEAVTQLLDRPAPGLVHLMLRSSLDTTLYAALGRPVCGVRGTSIIVTLPGSPKGASENMRALVNVLPHAVKLLRGVPDPHSHSSDKSHTVESSVPSHNINAATRSKGESKTEPKSSHNASSHHGSCHKMHSCISNDPQKGGTIYLI